MNDEQWQQWIYSDGTVWQQKRLRELTPRYPLSQCRKIMAAESVGDKAYQRALKDVAKTNKTKRQEVMPD